MLHKLMFCWLNVTFLGRFFFIIIIIHECVFGSNEQLVQMYFIATLIVGHLYKRIKQKLGGSPGDIYFKVRSLYCLKHSAMILK